MRDSSETGLLLLPFEIESLEITEFSSPLRYAISCRIYSCFDPAKRDAVTFPKLRLCAQKPQKSQFSNELLTIGDHIRRKRLDLELNYKETGQLLKTTGVSVSDWELNLHKTAYRFYPAIIQFIGYIPFEIGTSRAEQLIAYRKIRGITKDELAKEWQIERDSITRWENGMMPRKHVFRKRLDGIADRLLDELELKTKPHSADPEQKNLSNQLD